MIALVLALAACSTPDPGGKPGDTGPEQVGGDDAYEQFFAPDHLTEVRVELAPEDWEALRNQARNIIDLLGGEECLDDPWESPYTWFEAAVTVDGTRFERVAVRKKGLLGSVEPGRPSLKVKLDAYVDGQAYLGRDLVTLNNGRQDPSRLKQCLGYEIYARAGLPASRCSFAHVVVNDEDLGVYANVEPIEADYLERRFGDAGGHLYEGTLSDFREGWTGTFDDKTHESDYADIAGLTAALTERDRSLLAAIDPYVDVTQFIRAWALEVLIGHWDSYTGNTNNFFVYADPADGRFRFLPWGIDAILEGDEPFGAGAPVAATANSQLARRLYDLPETRALFRAELQRLLDEVWDEDALLERLYAMEELTADHHGPTFDSAAYATTRRGIKRFLSHRRADVEAELAGPEPEFAWPLADAVCWSDQGTVTVSFATTWQSYGTRDTFATGEGEMHLVYQGQDIPLTFQSAVLGEYQEGDSVMLLTGALDDGTHLAVYGLLRTSWFEQPGEVAADFTELSAYLLYDQDGGYTNWATWAYLGDGGLTLTESSTRANAPVSGAFVGHLYTGE